MQTRRHLPPGEMPPLLQRIEAEDFILGYCNNGLTLGLLPVFDEMGVDCA
ncbi:MAG: hypothetical protein R2867_14390 [Caldilineaceae bacterium]